jgi:hypothetical protein
MENEHKEVQDRLKEIKKVLADQDKTLPIPAGMLYAIGASNIFLDIVVDKIFACPAPDFGVKLMMTLGLIEAMSDGIITSFGVKLMAALGTLIVASLFALFASKIFVKKENEKLDRVFSKNQYFILRIYALAILVGVAFTMGTTVTGGWALVYFYWTAIFGLAAYVMGFFSKKLISRYGIFLIFAAIVQIMAAIIYAQPQAPSCSNMSAQTFELHRQIYEFGQYSAIFLVGFGHILIGYLLSRSKNV